MLNGFQTHPRKRHNGTNVLFRVALGIGVVTYIATGFADNLPSLVRAWASYALVDGVVALALVPPRDTYFGSFLIQGIWGVGAALIGFLLPRSLYPVLFVGIPLWAAGSTVLALVGVQQIRDIIEGRWVIALGVLGAAAGAYPFLSGPGSNITWLRAMIAGFTAANSVVFLLAARSLRHRRALG
jgi:hypothetical protein